MPRSDLNLRRSSNKLKFIRRVSVSRGDLKWINLKSLEYVRIRNFKRMNK